MNDAPLAVKAFSAKNYHHFSILVQESSESILVTCRDAAESIFVLVLQERQRHESRIEVATLGPGLEHEDVRQWPYFRFDCLVEVFESLFCFIEFVSRQLSRRDFIVEVLPFPLEFFSLA